MFNLDKFIADHVTHRPVTAAIKREQHELAQMLPSVSRLDAVNMFAEDIEARSAMPLIRACES